MKNVPLELKENIFKILVLYLHTDSIELINKELIKKINMSPEFLKNLPILINVKDLSNVKNWNDIRKIILSYSFRILGVSGCNNNILKNIIIKSGLPIISEEKRLIDSISKNKLKYSHIFDFNEWKKTKIITIPIRSGQKIYSINSDLIIINNVNSGAEIIADGNVHIYGNVRGRVLAGAQGDITRQIFCTKFFAELISIAGKYLLSDQFSPDIIGKSVRIYIKNEKLNVLQFN
ncbi:MAG: septum site-determining protein MinC [Buchnera aphidicola (Nurudea yanoniella)]